LFVGIAMLVASVTSSSRCSSGEPEIDTSATAALVASLRQRSLPGMPDPLTPEKAVEIEKWRTGPGGFFVQKGCFACHDVSVYGIKSAAPAGPDLAIAVEDVKSRFGMSLEEFFQTPIGTMSVVLSQMLALSPEDKALAIEKMREAHRELERRKHDAADDEDDDDEKRRGEGK
jgi:hypothetical protein